MALSELTPKLVKETKSIKKEVTKKNTNNSNNTKSIKNSVVEEANVTIVGRNEMVSPDWIDKKIQVHTGNNWKTILITNNHVGQKAGEFAATTVPAIFKRNKRKIGKIKYGS